VTFTELVACQRPIQLAGLGGGIGTPELALAVARAGGLGLIGHVFDRNELAAMVEGLEDPAPGQLGMNFLVPFLDPTLVDLVAPHVRVVDFFYGAPDSSLVERAHRGGALASWQVGDADEARAAVEAGVDFVIAQGTEAGGHVRGSLPRAEALTDVLETVSVPVLAAGGVATAADVSASLAAGADGVRVGTRFVTALESGAHPSYVTALLAATGADTELTTRFGADWPDAPHRVLRSCIDAANDREGELAGQTHPGDLTRHLGSWSSIPPSTATRGNIRAMALYAGTGVGECSIAPAGAIVDELMTPARRVT
jgi:NAD(P)H-dependent flavin oxidoreductase YrpB (nitropropane dioxygenase family)